MYSYELDKGISIESYETKQEAEIAAYEEMNELKQQEKGTFTIVKEIRLADLIDVDALIAQIYRSANKSNIDADDFIGVLKCDNYGLAQAIGACITGFVGGPPNRNNVITKSEKIHFLKHGSCVYFADRNGIECGLRINKIGE